MSAFDLLRARLGQDEVNKEDEAFRDKKLVKNARDARENGYDIVCAQCGSAYELDTLTMHETWCPDYDERAYA